MQAFAASTHAAMRVSAITVPSTHKIKVVIVGDEHDHPAQPEQMGRHDPTRYLSASEAGDNGSAVQKQIIAAILAQLHLPATTPFLISLEGAFADTFHLVLQGDTVQVINGPLYDAERLPDDSVMTLLLRY